MTVTVLGAQLQLRWHGPGSTALHCIAMHKYRTQQYTPYCTAPPRLAAAATNTHTPSCPLLFPPRPAPRSNRPSYEFGAFQELHDRRVTFMEGSAVSGQDLVSARAERARACLLLADRFTTDPEQEDLSILFQVCAGVVWCGVVEWGGAGWVGAGEACAAGRRGRSGCMQGCALLCIVLVLQ